MYGEACTWCKERFRPGDHRREKDHCWFHSGPKPTGHEQIQTCLEAYEEFCREVKQKG